MNAKDVWSSSKVYAVCYCADGKHRPGYVYDTFHTREEAKHNKEVDEHIVVMREYIYLEQVRR